MTRAGCLMLLSSCLCWLELAHAQWVSFSEDTTARLILQSFRDAPGSDPFLDDEEKDIAVADLDRDGRMDVVVVRKFPFSSPGARQDVLLMNENGVLVDRSAELAPGFRTILTDARDVYAGDFTGDGWTDLVIANTFGHQPRFYRNLGQDAGGDWLGLRDESALRLPFISVPGDIEVLQFCAVWGGDVTGDGALDLYFSNYRSGTGTEDVLLVNDGTGNFSNESAARLGSYANVAFGTGVEIQDVDMDGDNDIVKISTLYDLPPFDVGQYILFNDGAGVFDTYAFQRLPIADPYMFAVGDLDGNGLLDMYLQGDTEDRVILAQSAEPDTRVTYDGTTLFDPRTSDFGGNTKLTDIDGDGDLDVGVGPIDVDIANCGSSQEFALLRNDGSGSLDDPWGPGSDQNFHIEPHDFGFLDIDGDGCQDIIMGLCEGWRVFIQEGCAAALPAPLTAFLVRRGNLTAGDTDSLRLSDDDRALVTSELGQSQQVTISLIAASSPETAPSDIELTLEGRASGAGVMAVVELRDFVSSGWETVGRFAWSTDDSQFVISGLANASDFVRADGLLLARLRTVRSDPAYVVGVDLVDVKVTP